MGGGFLLIRGLKAGSMVAGLCSQDSSDLDDSGSRHGRGNKAG